jgi:UDP-N-acetylglucosamine diphosphorylase / glucose-1-phosphate thymidylyltransferase / UDP-N-acetylgalactosamine diphosphorylase / glucosamine-1-phosphate N-acetyltransferase / galactosamine-1-phosphate N-acetyltransferase
MSLLRIIAPTQKTMPVLLTNPLEKFPIGNLPLDQHFRPLGWNKLPNAWISQVDWLAAKETSSLTILDSNGEPLAWHGDEPDLTRTMHAFHSFLIVHSWDLLKANEEHLSHLAQSKIEGEVHASAVIEGNLELGSGSRILPGVFIEGNVVIGENCKIGPNCYIRGATSIGDHCHIGQAVEIKNSIILSHTSIGHLSYVGDSVIGRKVNFGAGTITSNLRHDNANHRTMVAGQLIDTGRRKFGAIIGDHVHTGIHTSIYPGRKLHPHTSTRPGFIVQKDLTA